MSRSKRCEITTRRRACSAFRRKARCEYSTVLELDLETIVPSVAGPKRPQDRIALPNLKNSFLNLLQQDAKRRLRKARRRDRRALCTRTSARASTRWRSVVGGGEQTTAPRAGRGNHVTPRENQRLDGNGNGQQPSHARSRCGSDPEEFPKADVDLGHGDVLIAAITSCTNTSNPSVMLAAGLLAKKAVERGLTVRPTVKNSLAPGSRVVTEYLEKTGLQPYLDQLGFNLVGYGCTTCIGNSGPLDPTIEDIVDRARFDCRQRAFRQSKF